MAKRIQSSENAPEQHQSIGFLAHAYAQENPQLVPPFLNMVEFDADFADAHGLWKLYNSIKLAASQDVPGTKAIYEELKKRFPCGRRQSKSKAE